MWPSCLLAWQMSLMTERNKYLYQDRQEKIPPIPKKKITFLIKYINLARRQTPPLLNTFPASKKKVQNESENGKWMKWGFSPFTDSILEYFDDPFSYLSVWQRRTSRKVPKIDTFSTDFQKKFLTDSFSYLQKTKKKNKYYIQQLLRFGLCRYCRWPSIFALTQK